MKTFLQKAVRLNGKGFRLLAFLCMSVSLMILPAWVASASVPLGIKKIECESKGNVEVNFNQNVLYKNVKVKVKDSAGKTVPAVITGKDRDDLDFRIKKYRMGETYTFKISGVSRWPEEVYQTIKGKVYITVVNGNVPVKSIEYDEKDREVEFSFAKAVQWKASKVEITDGKKKYSVKITEKNRKELEVKVKKLKKGKVYQFTITGIRKKGDTKYTKISGSFVA